MDLTSLSLTIVRIYFFCFIFAILLGDALIQWGTELWTMYIVHFLIGPFCLGTGDLITIHLNTRQIDSLTKEWLEQEVVQPFDYQTKI